LLQPFLPIPAYRAIITSACNHAAVAAASARCLETTKASTGCVQAAQEHANPLVHQMIPTTLYAPDTATCSLFFTATIQPRCHKCGYSGRTFSGCAANRLEALIRRESHEAPPGTAVYSSSQDASQDPVAAKCMHEAHAIHRLQIQLEAATVGQQSTVRCCHALLANVRPRNNGKDDRYSETTSCCCCCCTLKQDLHSYSFVADCYTAQRASLGQRQRMPMLVIALWHLPQNLCLSSN
jgi:hypothetical protein